ncbi:dihydroxyacetone kinase subunit DhaL [Boudabousia marimammalium]|uniref:Dihydroxyacetone kinase subunit L n=1 Tax=Boudabousia marimammalium TaxID=156892 RepID=A0A1Q5PSL8_9ACTO|nr:dihydroxyacetone kinase subunit DhaL [Boudabousia marimammalium]OKL50509.1 dihydroxyacetone kinase subunit L [Boudabousia marimammalium]
MSATVEQILKWMDDYAVLIRRHAADLTELDRLIGDADHGANMQRGMEAVLKLEGKEFHDASTLLKRVGMTLVSSVGGSSGPLYGTFFIRMAAAFAAESEDQKLISAETFGKGLHAGVEGIAARGKAEAGDKTMLDAWYPALAAYDKALAEGKGFHDSLEAAVLAAEQGAEDTIPMVAHKGRASYLGERSAGVKDPGAASSALLLRAAFDTFTQE